MQPLMTVKEVAAYLNVNPMTVYRAVETDTLPHLRLGRAIRFRREDVDAYLEGPKPVTPTPEPKKAPVTRL
jgi:excisionase family DNA binding protein